MPVSNETEVRDSTHYAWDQPAPVRRERIPAYLRELPVGASAWMEHKYLRALRMHGRKRGWILTYKGAGADEAALVNGEGIKHGRVWRLK
jgi:hypothetical protein